MDGSVANGVDGLRLPPAAAFGDGVVPFHLAPKRPAAEEAGWRLAAHAGWVSSAG